MAGAALADRLGRVRAAMAQAASARPVTLVAVSKLAPLSAVYALYDLGVRDFGENYVQPLVERAQALRASGRTARWHLLGGLQRNKAKLLVPHVHAVHAIDGRGPIDALCAAMRHVRRDAPIEIYVQVRLDGDAAAGRRGCAADEVANLATHVRACAGLRLMGLMGLPPRHGDGRPAFAALAALSRQHAQPGGALEAATGLSMGMSDDFSLAIAEGATVVRVGSALFGPRADAHA